MKNIILYIAIILTVSSCSIYRKYERPAELPVDSIYRHMVVDSAAYAAGEIREDTTTIAYMSWDEVFTDPHLQKLISMGLENNVDLQSAILRVESARAMVAASKWAYAPSIALAPQGGISGIAGNKAAELGINGSSWTYTVPASVSWDVDLFGSLLNAKRGAQASMLQSEAYRQAVKSQLVAGIANAYYGLLMLDEQVRVSNENIVIWKEQVRTMESLLKVGLAQENSVTQARANLYGLEASLASLVKQQRETENAICTLLGMPPFDIERGVLAEQVLPDNLNTGLPVQLLANRPDVYAAEMTLASAYYTTNQARSAFYPQLKLSGSAGWTNSVGQAIINPGAWILSALGSLTAPIFNHGKLVANLKVSKNEEEIARMNYKQAILNAGNEVNDALSAIETASVMAEKHASQCKDLERTVEVSERLYKTANGTYLEVLAARQSLLNAQLSLVSDKYQSLVSTVSLYQALGGGK